MGKEREFACPKCGSSDIVLLLDKKDILDPKGNLFEGKPYRRLFSEFHDENKKTDTFQCEECNHFFYAD